MIPNQSLVQPPIINAYLPPDNLENTYLIDYEMGGVGLSDPTQGLLVQTWTLEVLGTGAGTAVYVSAPNTPQTLVFSQPDITFARLAFDQNMHPFIPFLCSAGSGYFWWDPLIPGNTIYFFDPLLNITYAAATMDDKRALQTRLGTNDVILAYVRENNLCYRQQRDRYGVEYTLYAGISSLLSNPLVNKVGMNNEYRLQFELFGQLYQ